MAAKKARKRAYIPPSSEIVNRRERTAETRTTRATAQRSTGGARGVHPYPTPSLNRTLRRLPIYFVMIFALQYWLLSREAKGPEGTELLLASAASAGLVTVIFAPFMHMMDRLAYNRHLRRSDDSKR
jgi:hypothetical protein